MTPSAAARRAPLRLHSRPLHRAAPVRTVFETDDPRPHRATVAHHGAAGLPGVARLRQEGLEAHRPPLDPLRSRRRAPRGDSPWGPGHDQHRGSAAMGRGPELPRRATPAGSTPSSAPASSSATCTTSSQPAGGGADPDGTPHPPDRRSIVYSTHSRATFQARARTSPASCSATATALHTMSPPCRSTPCSRSRASVRRPRISCGRSRPQPMRSKRAAAAR